MNDRFSAGTGALVLAVCVAFSALPAVAAESENIEVIFTDVTDSDLSTLSGEAKIKVSVRGAQGDASIAQMDLGFTGDLNYKSIQFLQGENDPPECVQYSPNAALVNSTKELLPSIISRNPMSFEDETDLFILTFSGDAGDSLTLSIADTDNTYCTVDGNDLKPSENESITVTASDKANEGKNAALKLTMDKVTDFAAGGTDGYNGSGIEVKITSENTPGYTVYTILNNTLVSNGGHRESESIPTFTIENTVLADDTYTVEVSGIGYIPYRKTGVTFDDVLEITNAELIPGDINADGKVDITDKEECEKAIEDEAYANDLAGAADFNRDGTVDKYDLAVFDGITAPEEPDDDNNGGGTGGGTGGGNTGGGGSTGGGGGGGTGGGGGGGTSSASPTATPAATSEPGTPTATAAPSSSDEAFTDLENYEWAKDAIYALKDKGIISGVSETEYAPASNIKRGDFILILTRMMGIDNEFTENFADVPESAYYYDAIGSAKAAGVATGDGENFMPENSITRQDLITLAYRAFLSAGYIEEADELTSLDVFADKDSISDYAAAPMASMVKAGIIQGSDGKVNPTGNATRAEVAVMCARLLELMQ